MKLEGTYRQPHRGYQAVKNVFLAEVLAVESCINKCGIKYDASSNMGLNGTESHCMKKCSNKYFDGQLLIKKEVEVYTAANPYMS